MPRERPSTRRRDSWASATRAVRRSSGSLREGDAEAFEFPVAMAREPGLDFSFSGLKTALLYAVRELDDEELDARRADLAASFQAAVVGQLVAKLERALEAGTGPPSRWAVASLRTACCANACGEICAERGLRLKLVAPELCTDNAAMIGAAATELGADAAPRSTSRWDAGDEEARPLRAAGCHLCDEARELVMPLRCAKRATSSSSKRSTSTGDERLLAASWSGFRCSSSTVAIIGELEPDTGRAAARPCYILLRDERGAQRRGWRRKHEPTHRSTASGCRLASRRGCPATCRC